MWLNSAFASLCLQTIVSDLRVNVTSGIKITLASRTFTSVLLIYHNHNQYNKATCKQMQQLPTMLGPAVHRRKDSTHKTLETMCDDRVWPQQIGRAVQMDPKLLTYAKGIEECRKNLEQVFICQIYLFNSPRSTIKNAFRSAYSFLFFILCF